MTQHEKKGWKKGQAECWREYELLVQESMQAKGQVHSAVCVPELPVVSTLLAGTNPIKGAEKVRQKW